MAIVVCGLFMSSMVLGGAAVADGQTLFLSFDREDLPPGMKQNDVDARIVPHEGKRAMEVQFHVVDYPNVFFTPPSGTWDWSAYAGVEVDLFNPSGHSVSVCIRVDNAGADGATNCVTNNTVVPAGERATLRARFGRGGDEAFWGMRGLPVRGPVGSGPAIDPAKITAFQVFLGQPAQAETLIIEEVRLYGQGQSLTELVPFPFVNEFGQYMHAKWPGKLKNEKEFAKRIKTEQRAIQAAPKLPVQDKFGGWADGPQREATGWFRTEQIDGKWWLVTPEGHLFFSSGMDCVGNGEQTFISGRDGWFAWLPDPAEAFFKDCYSKVSGAHSMADIIGGKGDTFSYYRANLYQKYGGDWAAQWRASVYPRLQSWGFNTIANWAQDDVLENSPMPFTGSIGIWGDVRELEGARGYWGRMRDVFDASFAKAADQCVASVAEKFGKNPLCIGYFVDNEMSWETIRMGTLASPPDQPCRIALIDELKKKYESLDKLNAAWGTDAKDWDALRAPEKTNETCDADLEAFVYTFARRYFETVSAAIKKYAPHQLYLGCRFSSAPSMAVKACADVADIVSYNLYQTTINADRWTGKNDLGKPMIIGEFHFGALDRGMFHTGLVPTKDQEDRAEHYIAYVRSVVDCPAFVGCHWFQYIDEPITGRWYDGENYNIGFLDVTDTPYPEMVKAAKKVHAEIYPRRYGRKAR